MEVADRTDSLAENRSGVQSDGIFAIDTQQKLSIFFEEVEVDNFHSSLSEPSPFGAISPDSTNSSVSCSRTAGNVDQENTVNVSIISRAMTEILRCVDSNPGREGLLKTPERYARSMIFFTSGYQLSIPDVVNGSIFNGSYDELVLVKSINVSSLCEHHLVPFIGKVHVGYIPDGRIIGLSKIPRIVEVFARRLQTQEHLTSQIAAAIQDVLNPRGVAVLMEASHLCMVMRGVQKVGSSTTTSCFLGLMKEDRKARQEFLAEIKT